MSDASLHMNLKQVVENLAADAALPAKQKRDLLSAINTLAKWLERPLDMIPADRRQIRTVLEELNHSQLGVSKKRLQNVRSLLNQALDQGMVGQARKSAVPLSNAWSVLIARVPENWRRYKLTQLARYCSAKDIAPDRVDGEVFKVWLIDRTETASLAKKPERAVEDAHKVWNHCAGTLPDWPGQAVPMVSKRQAVLMPMSSLPVSLAGEIAKFEAASLREESADIAGTNGRRSYRGKKAGDGQMKKVTARVVQNRVNAIRMCASALCETNECSPAELKSISDIVTADHAALMVDTVIARTGKVSEYPHSLVKSLRAVSVQWLNADVDEINAFNAILSDLAEDVDLGALTPENRKRLAPFANGENVARLVSLPAGVFHQLEERRRKGPVTLLMACKARTAIAIAILTMLPVRRANLCSIEINKQLVLPSLRQDQARMAFAPQEVKNKRSVGCVVSEDMRTLLDLYVKYYRPIIVGNNPTMSAFLLATQSGMPVTGGALSNNIRALVKAETGLTVNVHLFRHVMAAVILRAHPGQLDTVRALLGHSNDSRVTQLYAEIAVEVAADVLEEAVASAKRPKPRRRPLRTRKWKR